MPGGCRDADTAEHWWDFYGESVGRYLGVKLNIPSDEMANSYMDLCYHRGAWFLKELMDTMGEEDFLETVSGYCNRYLYQNASTEDFLNVLACHGEADISGLLEEYLDVEMNWSCLREHIFSCPPMVFMLYFLESVFALICAVPWDWQ